MKTRTIVLIICILAVCKFSSCKKCFTCTKEVGTDASGQVTTIDERQVCVYGGAKAAARDYENDGYSCDY